MTPIALHGVFGIAPGPIRWVLFARLGLAVGVPLLGCTLAGMPLAAVVAGGTAMFVSLCDIGATRRARVGTMFAGTLVIAAGGVLGDRFGGQTEIDEMLVLAAAFVAAWVSNSHPGIAAVARFGALAVAAGVGIQTHDALLVIAVLGGGAAAALAALAGWSRFGFSPDNTMDWRAGLRRAIGGADAGPWFAVCFALAATSSLAASTALGLNRPYWAAFTVIMTMRREGMVALRLVLQYVFGTMLGVILAALLNALAGSALTAAAFAVLAAACSRTGMALNPALGFAAFTVFLVMTSDLVLGGQGAPLQLLTSRLYDVGVGAALVVAGTLLASAAQARFGKPAPPQ